MILGKYIYTTYVSHKLKSFAGCLKYVVKCFAGLEPDFSAALFKGSNSSFRIQCKDQHFKGLCLTDQKPETAEFNHLLTKALQLIL